MKVWVTEKASTRTKGKLVVVHSAKRCCNPGPVTGEMVQVDFDAIRLPTQRCRYCFC